MLKTFISRFQDELKSFPKMEKLFILCAMFCGFCITFEYAITKPTSSSIFIAEYGVKCFPYAWLALVPLNLFVVSLYNRLLPKIRCFKIHLIICGITIGMNTLCAFWIQEVPSLSFILFIWKDIYVLLMFQQVWSVIHSTIKAPRVKYLYGILFGVGGFGALFGSLIPGFCAVKMGSPHLLLMTVPVYLIFVILYWFLLKSSHQVPGSQFQNKLEPHSNKTSQGLRLIRDSRFLQFIMLIVILMQIGATIVEYQFSSYLEIIQPLRDLRTEYLGRVHSVINCVNILFQFVGSFILVQLLGLKRSHFLVPGVLCSNALLSLIFPMFGFITFSYGTVKTFEYSFFTIIKEMLYNPLKVEEKFKAKAIIDVFAFRTSKALASIFIIFFGVYLHSKLLSWVVLFLFALWVFVIRRMFKQKELLQFETQ